MCMTENRYRYDTGTIIDQKNGEILTTRKTVNRLNKQDRIIQAKKEQIKFHVEGYNHIKQTIQEAIKYERTSMGKSVLKQLADNLGVEY